MARRLTVPRFRATGDVGTTNGLNALLLTVSPTNLPAFALHQLRVLNVGAPNLLFTRLAFEYGERRLASVDQRLCLGPHKVKGMRTAICPRTEQAICRLKRREPCFIDDISIPLPLLQALFARGYNSLKEVVPRSMIVLLAGEIRHAYF
jgi:hypothetical protein